MGPTRILNFSPGPAKLPESVMQKAKAEFLSFGDTGVSVMEISHRSKDFDQIINGAISTVRELMQIPDNYKVLFLQGGGNGQFASVPMNLIGRSASKTADYVVTGSWSAIAVKEAKKYGNVNLVLPQTESYTDIPDPSTWKLDPEAAYVYYCANETVNGVEFQYIPETNGVPLVCDMSSNILSRPVDVSKFGLIYAGAQKNIGCAGVTMVIVREDLLGACLPICPTVLDYTVMAAKNSLFNTPPTYSIYIMGLVFDWVREQGGVSEMETRAIAKSSALYGLIDQSTFYWAPVKAHCRSRMNVPFHVGSTTGDEGLEKLFVDESTKAGMKQLKGHRMVGGLRASLYNAVTLEETNLLLEFMRTFLTDHQGIA